MKDYKNMEAQELTDEITKEIESRKPLFREYKITLQD